MNNEQTITTRQERLAALYQVSARLTTTLALSELSNLVLDAIIQLTGAERGFLVLVDEMSGELELAAARNVEQETIEAGSMEISRTIVQRTVNTGEPILSDNAAEDERFFSHQSVIVYRLRSIMCAPLRAAGRIIGAVHVDNRLQAGLFSREDLELLITFANQTAMAIENARLYEEVQKAKKAKSDFVSVVSHELRIPMTSIRGYTDLLLGEMVGPLTEPQKQFLQTVKRNLDRMNVLVRDLSDINRIESGRMRFDMSEFDLREVVLEVAGDLQESTEARRQTLTLDLPETLPPVQADRSRVTQVLTNLLNNAHKYTPEEGEIDVYVGREDDRVRVEVRDNGIGIAPADQAHLFTQFFRSDNDLVREQLGWGLGLSMVKKLVEAQGGEVGFASEPGKGSTFTFALPLSQGRFSEDSLRAGLSTEGEENG